MDRDVFKHFLIDEGGVEKLIEIWTFFNPKDTPYPLTKNTLCLNNKYNDVTAEQVLNAVKFEVFKNLYWLDRFHVICFTLKSKKPIDFLYDHFIENHKFPDEERLKKKKVFDDIEDTEVPKKERKTKKNGK